MAALVSLEGDRDLLGKKFNIIRSAKKAVKNVKKTVKQAAKVAQKVVKVAKVVAPVAGQAFGIPPQVTSAALKTADQLARGKISVAQLKTAAASMGVPPTAIVAISKVTSAPTKAARDAAVMAIAQVDPNLAKQANSMANDINTIEMTAAKKAVKKINFDPESESVARKIF